MTINGSNGNGSVFRVDTTGDNFSTLVRFDRKNGQGSKRRSLTHNGSELYGYARGGVNNYGVVFSV